MKTTNKFFAALFILSISASGFAQAPQTPDSLGLPGDNLNLYGVLYLFKESKSVEEFEQKLNTPDNKVNNLDLNHDGQTDYILVKDYGKNGLHSLVLQDPITATESQDLAVVEIEQQGTDNAHIQIVGDEDLYGKNYIIEPQDQQQAQQAAPLDNSAPVTQVYVNVWAWPSIQYMYTPSYVYWNSPWYWGYYPHWWSPWRPMHYHAYWRDMYGYRGYYHRGYQNHIIAAQTIYYGHRQQSVIVHNNITNNVYHGPRTGGKVAGGNGTAPNNTPRTTTGPRTAGGKQAFNPGQPKEVTPRQQSAPKPQVQSIPKQQSAPRQQQAPHNNSGVRKSGGGHSGGSGHNGGGGHSGGGHGGGRR
ncbi:MAG: hypothetical protein ABI388_03875 [Bacteroidia bacterium]